MLAWCMQACKQTMACFQAWRIAMLSLTLTAAPSA